MQIEEHYVCGFSYMVMGTQVVRRGPSPSPSTVWSPIEIEESLTQDQLRELDENLQKARSFA